MSGNKPTYEELERRCRLAETRLATLDGEGTADRYRVIFEKSPLGMIRFSPDGTILDCNQRFVDLMGSSRKQLIGFNTARQSTPEMRRTIKKALAGDTAVYEDEYTSITGGKTLWLRVAFNPVHPGQSPTEVIATLEDVSERKAAEEALKKSEARYRILLESVSDSVFVLDKDWNQIVINEAATQFTGLAAEKLLNENLLNLFPGIELTPFFKLFQQVMESRQADVVESEYHFPDGRKGWYEINVYPVPEGILCISRDITKRKGIEEELRKSEARYRDIFNNSLWGIFQSTVEGRFLRCNAAFAKTLGYDSPEDLVSSITDIPRQYYVDPADRRRYIRLLEKSGIVENYEFKVRRKDGARIWVNNSTQVVRDETGKIRYFEGVVVDITDRKRAERALAESEELFRKMFEEIPVGIVFGDIDTSRIVKANPSFCRMCGYTEEEVRELTIADLSHPEDMPKNISFFRDALKKKSPNYRMEKRYLTKNGAVVWANLTGALIYDIDGNAKYRVGIIDDITEKKRSEEALRNSEARYRRLTENLQDIIWRTDQQGKIVFISRAVQSLLGYSPEEVIGLAPSDYMTRNAMERLLEKIDAIRRNQIPENHFKLEIDYIAKSGEPAPFEINLVALKNADGKIAGYEGVSRDIAERKQMERDLIKAREAAESASRAKSEFIANMSHELRTPLNAILGYGQILLRDETLSDLQRQNVDVMKTSGDHLLMLINDILDIARIEAGKLKLEPGSTDLKALIANVAAMLRAKAVQKNIDLVEDISPNLPRFIEADEKRLRQVLLNLLSNAVKFTHRGRVILRVRPALEKIAFTVADTGVGIPEDKRTAIFHAFEQLSPIAHKTEGTGLGLAISQNLVRLMGGRIAVKSGMGRGSVFRFKIPLVDMNGGIVERRIKQAECISNSSNIGDAISVAAIIPPPKTDITALHAMSRIGDLSAIVDYAVKMREADPRLAAFCRTLERHAAEFDMTAIRDLIEGFMGGDA